MQSYKINSLKVMGDEHPTYGYTYFGYVHDVDMPVRFSTKLVIDDIKDKGRTLYAADKEVRTSAAGKDYLQLKKVSFEEQEQTSFQATGDFPKAKPAVDNKYYRDITTTYIQIYNGSLNYAKEAGLNLISDKEDRRVYLEYVKDITDELMGWISNARNNQE